MRPRLSYANVVSTICLFVVLGGTSYALAKGEIGTRELEDNGVRSIDLRNGGTRSIDIRDGTIDSIDVGDGKLLSRDFKAGELPRGEKGEAGEAGKDGTNGAPGATNVVIRFNQFDVNAMSLSGQNRAECQGSERAVGGGVGFTTSPGSNDRVVYTGPGLIGGGLPGAGVTPTAWEGVIFNSEGGMKTARTYVVCASP